MTKGERIKLLREKKGITQEELAKLLNTTKQTISKYENGIVTNIPSDKLDEMIKIFDITPNYLMGWESRVEENPVETANQLSEIFLDQELMEMISTYQSLDADKKKQVRDFIYFLKGRS